MATNLFTRSSIISSYSEFFGKLFESRDYIHLSHLSINGPGSYAYHKATNKFYDDILELTDSLIESYQGIYGITQITIPQTSSSINGIDYLQGLYDYINMKRNIFRESFLQNIIDEIQQLISQTLYKLKNLS